MKSVVSQLGNSLLVSVTTVVLTLFALVLSAMNGDWVAAILLAMIMGYCLAQAIRIADSRAMHKAA